MPVEHHEILKNITLTRESVVERLRREMSFRIRNWNERVKIMIRNSRLFLFGVIGRIQTGSQNRALSEGVILPTSCLIWLFRLNPQITSLSPTRTLKSWQPPALAKEASDRRHTVIDSQIRHPMTMTADSRGPPQRPPGRFVLPRSERLESVGDNFGAFRFSRRP
jgi:hypothetical protein